MLTAASLISTHGCAGTSIQDIITAAGLTKGAFYHHFKSKNALCIELIETAAQQYRQLAQSLDPALSPLEKLIQYISTLQQLNSAGKWTNCKLLTKLSSELTAANPDLEKKLSSFWQWYISFFEDLLLQAKNQNQLPPSLNCRNTALAVISILTFFSAMQKFFPDINPAQIISAILQNKEKTSEQP